MGFRKVFQRRSGGPPCAVFESGDGPYYLNLQITQFLD